jgi:hypothetical protein
MAGLGCLNAMTALQEQWTQVVAKEFEMDEAAMIRLRKCLDMGDKSASKGPGRPKGKKKASTKSDAPTCRAVVWNNGVYNEKACCGKKSVGDDGHGHALCKKCLQSCEEVKANERSDGTWSYGKDKDHLGEAKWYGIFDVDPAPVFYEGPDYATKAARDHDNFDDLKEKKQRDPGKGFDILSGKGKRLHGAWHKPLTPWPGCEMPSKDTEAEVVVKSVVKDTESEVEVKSVVKDMVEEAMSQSDAQLDRDDTVVAEEMEEIMFDKVPYKVVVGTDDKGKRVKFAYPAGDWYKGKLTWDIKDWDTAFAEVDADDTLEFTTMSLSKAHDIAATDAQ